MGARRHGSSRDDANRVAVIGLAARFHAPRAASPRTRETVPAGYGVAEQCLPFTAAAALGLAIPAPFAWGFCAEAAAPPGARRFRSPIAGGCRERMFYVVDDPEHGFARNRYTIAEEVVRRAGPAPVPGLSFFDRSDQQDHVKVHLPYVLKTAPAVGLLFTAPINRPRADGLEVVAGLVECDWYANPVNLVLRLPPAPAEVHVVAGAPLAQAIPIARAARRPALDRLQPHRRETRATLEEMAAWRAAHDRDRSAYKRLAKSAHGRLGDDGDGDG